MTRRCGPELLASHTIDQLAAREDADECVLRAARGIVSRGISPYIHKDILHGVLGILGSRGQTPRHGPNQSTVAADTLSNSRPIAGGNLG
jgi:hypothetical protein